MNFARFFTASLLVISFLAAGLTMAQENASSEAAASGVSGMITMTPVEPGPTRKDALVPSAVAAKMAFEVKQGDRVVQTFTTDDAGRFEVHLPPGHYSVIRQGGKSAIGSFGPFEVDVVAGKMTPVEWKCDTGLR